MKTNQTKLNRLFELACQEPAPLPPPDFAADILRSVRREPPAREPLSLAEQLNVFFPRIAWVAAMVIVLGIAVDFALTAAGVPGLNDGVAQLSTQWWFTPDNLGL